MCPLASSGILISAEGGRLEDQGVTVMVISRIMVVVWVREQLERMEQVLTYVVRGITNENPHR